MNTNVLFDVNDKMNRYYTVGHNGESPLQVCSLELGKRFPGVVNYIELWPIETLAKERNEDFSSYKVAISELNSLYTTTGPVEVQPEVVSPEMMVEQPAQKTL